MSDLIKKGGSMKQKETKLGINLLVWWTRFGSSMFILIAGIIMLILIQDPHADGIIIGILALIVSVALGYLLWKLADSTQNLESNAWWWQMILAAVGIFSLNPISLVIFIYLWINKDLFEIGNKTKEDIL